MKHEAKRQLFHAFFGIIIVLLFYFDIMHLFLFGIIIVVGMIICIAWKKNAEPIIAWFLKNFERNGHHTGTGAFFYIVGCFIVLLLFPEKIAFASIMILALGDSTSHYVGQYYGKIKHPFNKKRNLEGTLAGILAGFIGAAFFVPPLHAFFAACIAMNLEAIEWKVTDWRIDDNLYVPVVAAIVLFFLL